MRKEYIKPCPFCGQNVDSLKEDPDFCYPATRPDPHTGNQVFRAGCIECAGGCGAEVLGNSPSDAIERWNTRV